MRGLRQCLTLAALLLVLAATVSAMSEGSQQGEQGKTRLTSQRNMADSASTDRFSTVEEMAKRVDSLQFIVVYNAEVLRRDLDSKVVWIYVMLGVMIVASMMMYGALNQAQRQKRDLEERVFEQLTSSTTELRSQIKGLEDVVNLHHPAKKAAPPRAKKRG